METIAKEYYKNYNSTNISTIVEGNKENDKEVIMSKYIWSNNLFVIALEELIYSYEVCDNLDLIVEGEITVSEEIFIEKVLSFIYYTMKNFNIKEPLTRIHSIYKLFNYTTNRKELNNNKLKLIITEVIKLV